MEHATGNSATPLFSYNRDSDIINKYICRRKQNNHRSRRNIMISKEELNLVIIMAMTVFMGYKKGCFNKVGTSMIKCASTRSMSVIAIYYRTRVRKNSISYF